MLAPRCAVVNCPLASSVMYMCYVCAAYTPVYTPGGLETASLIVSTMPTPNAGIVKEDTLYVIPAVTPEKERYPTSFSTDPS